VTDADLVDLERSLKALPGVLGCVIMSDSQGAAAEIQAFTRRGTDQQAIQDQIQAEAAARGIAGQLRQIYVFELEAESHFGDRETLERAAELAEQDARMRGPRSVAEEALVTLHTVVTEPGGAASKDRPPLLRVSFSSTSVGSEAEVALGGQSAEVIGQASGEKTTHGLKVLAEATLEAVSMLVGEERMRLVGASLVEIVGEEAVLVLVKEDDGPEMLGGALIRGGPVTEAAVRATLDAINRRLTHTH
jgi:hypothetical protein